MKQPKITSFLFKKPVSHNPNQVLSPQTDLTSPPDKRHKNAHESYSAHGPRKMNSTSSSCLKMTLPSDPIEILKKYFGPAWAMDYPGLHAFLSSPAHSNYFQLTVPFMAEMIHNVNAYCPDPILQLPSGSNGRVSFTPEQVVCIISHGILLKSLPTSGPRGMSYPKFMFESIYEDTSPQLQVKLQFIFGYIERMRKELRAGSKKFTERRIEIWRRVKQDLDWTSSLERDRLPFIRLHETGKMEDHPTAAIVDFANSYIGGGVLNMGFVQEEILFLVYPECLVSLLVAERMSDKEAIGICGVIRFSEYDGYGHTTAYKGDCVSEPVPRTFLAIDATNFSSQRRREFTKASIHREIYKAFVGFSILEQLEFPSLEIATGHWGCGAFRGDTELKAIIQIVAASISGVQTVNYYAFGDASFSSGMKRLLSAIKDSHKNKLSNVKFLYDCIMAYNPNNASYTSVFEHILDEMKARVSIRES